MKEQKLEELKELENLGIIERIACTDDEAKSFRDIRPDNLPEDVYAFTVVDQINYARYPDLSESEIQRRIALINAKNIRTTKNCVLFIAVLAAISIAAGVILALVALGGG